MARAPKQWCLTKTETVTSYENWRQNIVYTLSLDPNFSPFLVEGTTWTKKTAVAPLRGFTNDGEDVAQNSRRTATQKITMLELMLGQIANYCPILSRNTIVKNSTSVSGIWQVIRSHYGFQATGAHFIDFNDIKLGVEERAEDLYQRLTAFAEDNLLLVNGGITHHGEAPTIDEDVSPSLENFIVLTWLRLLHSDLPHLVKQRYGTELRSRTLASIKPEISQALDSLLDELKTAADAKVLRSAATNLQRNTQRFTKKPSMYQTPAPRFRTQPKCPLCREARRSDDHFLSKCKYLPEHDKKFMTHARHVICEDDDLDFNECSIFDPNEDDHNPKISIGRVQVKQSPYINVFHNHHDAHITLDSGAEANMMRESVALTLNAKITKSNQTAFQADGKSPMTVVGEVRITFTRSGKTFTFEGLVVENLDVDILAGVPFLSLNDITIRTAKHHVILDDGTIYTYGTVPTQISDNRHVVRRTQAHVLRAPPSSTTVWPGEYVEVDLPENVPQDTSLALEPRTDSHVSTASLSKSQLWPTPDIITAVGNIWQDSLAQSYDHIK